MLTYLDNPIAGTAIFLLSQLLIISYVAGRENTLRTLRPLLSFVRPMLESLANATVYRNVTRPEVVARLTYGIRQRETTAECLQKYGEALE